MPSRTCHPHRFVREAGAWPRPPAGKAQADPPPPTHKMSGVRAAHDIDFMDTDLFFFADALEHAFRTRSLHADLNSGILGFERLAQPFRDWNFHARVEREGAFLPGGLDH